MPELDLLKNIKYPSFVQFETNNRCNALCEFCCYKDMQREHCTMPWSHILSIIDDSIRHGTTAFCPFLMQEPLLEPRLLPILRNIKMQNHHIADVSFYAPTPEIYHHLQPPLHYDVTAANIRRFMQLKRDGNYPRPHVNLHYIAMPTLYPHAQSFMETWSPIVDNVGFVHYDNWHGDQPDLEQDCYWPRPPETERLPCSRIWNSLQVLSNGEVVPCCIDYEAMMPMGNIKDASLTTIWNNQRFQDLRRLHVARRFNELPLCKDCTVWRYQHSQEWINFWKHLVISAPT
jgi:radical SAM protein with 4Fe4S-binding SPASM domain